MTMLAFTVEEAGAVVAVINAAAVGAVAVIHALRSPQRRTAVTTTAPTITEVSDAHG